MPGKNASPGWLLETFDELVPEGANKKSMFGHPAMWVGGNMFVMLVDDELGVRLGDEHKQEFLELRGAVTFEPRGKCNFHGMVRVPKSKLKDKTFLRNWVERAFLHTASLPPKPSGGARRAAGSKSK